MGLKYWFEFTDVQKTVNRVEILKDDFTDDSTQIFGKCSLTKTDVSDTLYVIRGGGLTIDIEASSDIKFTDLYSEDERVFSVKYYRDSELIFYGWLSPEGLYQSYVTDKWIISLDCTDGLGFLKNLSYVDNVTKEQFYGKQKVIDIIANCLKRTDLEQNIYTKVSERPTYPYVVPENVDILDNIWFNSERYIKSDNTTVMSCDEVLTSVLELFSACITQYKGNWIVYRPTEMLKDSTMSFYGYDYNAVALVSDNLVVDYNQEIGSQIDGFYPHHVNGNQQLTIDSPIGAYRINYKYGFVNSVFLNLDLASTTTPPSTCPVIDEWTVDDCTYVTANTNDLGLVIESLSVGSTPIKVLTSDSFNFLSTDLLKIVLNFKGVDFPNLQSSVLRSKEALTFNYKVVLVAGLDTYYLNKYTGWTTTDNEYTIFSSVVRDNNSIGNVIINTPYLPADGVVYLELYTPVDGWATSTGNLILNQFYISPLTDESAPDIEGEIHTFQRISKPSSKISETKVVYNGDIESDLYVGTIYQKDDLGDFVPVESWEQTYILLDPVYTPLLKLNGIARLRMNQKPLRVFSGDIYGYIDYFNLVSINGLDGVYNSISYKYDCKENITTLKLKEIYPKPDPFYVDELLSDIDYLETVDYGDVTDPTIN